MMHAAYEILKHEPGKYIYIQDVGYECRSVTNDAEWVIGQLFRWFGIDAETRVFYDDSCGRTDELLHSGGKFKGFKAGHDGVDL